MGLQEFKIYFDNPYATYYPEQTVTGKVVLTLNSPKKVRGLRLTVKGEADTCWTVDRQELNNEGRYVNETDTVTAIEKYFKAEFYLLGSQSGEEIEIPPGTHTYPFNYVLPPNLPSSFESDFGRVRYTLKATLDRPWKFDQESKVAFSIVSQLDLNEQQTASLPIHIEKNKTFCCLCCASMPLSVNISLPVKGYVPGQTIPIKVNVENQSGVEVEKVKLMLQKVITYIANIPRSERKVVETTVAEVSKGPIGGNETTSYEQSLDVPPLPPSSLNHCGIIELEYKIKFTACVSGTFRKNLSGSTNILIGTVPLSNYQMPQPPIQNMDYPTKPEEASQGMYPSMPTPSAPEDPSNYNPSSNLYPNIAPPSYEESVYGIRSLRDSNESDKVIGAMDKFAPRYPVYNFKSSQ